MTIVISSQDSSAVSIGIHVADILRRVGSIMNDEDHVRWTELELIDWINDAAGEIVLRRPAARAVIEIIALASGTRQNTPDGTSQLLNVVRNWKAGGTPGSAISITDMQAMNAADPDWHAARAGTTRQYMIDERSPTTFYVYPPATNGAQVEVLVAKPPPKVVANTDTLDMRPEFIGALLNWIMYRCHTKDSEYANGAVAAQHYQAFADAIGAPAQAAQTNSATGNSV